MALIVYTPTPNKLVNQIKEAIDVNSIDTWAYDDKGDFYHDVDQWRKHAWMRVKHVEPGKYVIFGVIGRKNTPMAEMDFAVHQGRFAEMLLAHFRDLFSKIEIFSQLTEFDVVNSGIQ